MPRQTRKKSGTGIYHVMLRGINRQDIFEEEEDYLHFLKSMSLVADSKDDAGRHIPSPCTFYTYCLMPNHIHLLLQERTASIGEIVKRLHTLTITTRNMRGTAICFKTVSGVNQ